MAEGVSERICVETIYQAIYAVCWTSSPTECRRRRRRPRRPRQARHANKRPALANIGLRPSEVGDRSEIGHWEADHLIG